MDKISELRLINVFPVLANKIRQAQDILTPEDIYIRVVQGLRTIAEQNELYAQGRTKPGRIVTKAKGEESYHCMGLACDVVPSKNGINSPFDPEWDSSNHKWKRVVEVCHSLGLDCGAMWLSFKDHPHVQITGRFPYEKPDEEALKLSDHGKLLKPLWDAVENVL